MFLGNTPFDAAFTTGTRVNPKGPVHVLIDGVWKQFPGPISLEQFYGRTSDRSQWQPKGNTWEPPAGCGLGA